MGRIDRSTSQFLDAARWISALAVVVSHVCAMLLIDDNQVTQPGLALQALFYLKNTGHLAVVIFFVLSGYLVGGQELLRLLDGRRFDLARYGIQRFSRIYTVLVPALLLTLLLDQAGQAFFNTSEIYTNPALQNVGSLMYPIAGRDDSTTFLGNLLMLQTIAVEPFGGDGPLWSLANEWWYYAIFGLFLVFASPAHAPAWRAVAMAASLVLLAVLPASISLWFLLWLLGVGAALLGRSWKGIAFSPALAVLTAGAALSLLGMSWSSLLADLPLEQQNAAKLSIDAVAALAFVLALLSARNAVFRGGGAVHATLASFSYSLYAVHFPLLVFLAAAANTLFGLRFGQPLGVASLACTVLITLLIAAAAWCIAQTTERHTHMVRAALTTLMTRQPKLG
jgi:peptidoglycan/LPS O-acetylase OafA/YrhL